MVLPPRRLHASMLITLLEGIIGMGEHSGGARDIASGQDAEDDVEMQDAARQSESNSTMVTYSHTLP